MQQGLAVAKLLAALPSFFFKVYGAVAEATVDGKISADEAGAIARKVSEEEPELLNVRVKSTDIVDPETQHQLAAVFGRMARNLVNALA